MKKLGTKGPLLLHYYNGELRVLFELLAPLEEEGSLFLDRQGEYKKKR